MKSIHKMSIFVVLIAILASVPSVNATGYMDGSNWTGIDSILDSYGFSYLKINNGMSNPATADFNAAGYNVTNATSISAKNIGGVIYADQYPTIQDAINTCNILIGCGIVRIPAGTYTPSGQLSSSLSTIDPGYAGTYVGLVLPSNIIIEGEGNKTILQNVTALTATGGVGQFTMFINSNFNTGNNYITIRNLRIELPPPKETAVGMDSWDGGFLAMGCTHCELENIEIVNGTIGFYANRIDVNTPNVLKNMSNSFNTVRDVNIYNATGTPVFSQGVGNLWTHSNVYNSWDDTFALMSSGKDNIVENSIFDGSPVVVGKGGMSGVLLIHNDGNFGGQTNNKILNNVVRNAGYHYNAASGYYGISLTGSSNGSYISGNTVIGNNATGIYLEPNNNIFDYIISNNIIENNLGYGMDVRAGNPAIRKTGNIYGNLIKNNIGGIFFYGYGNSSQMMYGNTIYNNNPDILYLIEPGQPALGTDYIYGNDVQTITATYGIGNATIRDNKNVAPFNHGNYASAPTAFGAGDTYFNTTANILQIYTGSIWEWFVTSTVSSNNIKDQSINFVINNGSNVIGTGIKGDVEIPFTGIIIKSTALADQTGSVNISWWKDSYANFPPTSADILGYQAISSSNKGQSTGLTQAVTAGDILRFNVESADIVTRVTISLTVRRS